MKFYNLLFGKKATISELKEIDKYVKYITSSCITNDNEDLGRLKIYRYSDNDFCIVKTILKYPDGAKQIGYSIIIDYDKQVYNGNIAVNLDLWFDHLKEVYNMAVEEEENEKEEQYNNDEIDELIKRLQKLKNK